jgi:hypothetical protein
MSGADEAEPAAPSAGRLPEQRSPHAVGNSWLLQASLTLLEVSDHVIHKRRDPLRTTHAAQGNGRELEVTRTRRAATAPGVTSEAVDGSLDDER